MVDPAAGSIRPVQSNAIQVSPSGPVLAAAIRPFRVAPQAGVGPLRGLRKPAFRLAAPKAASLARWPITPYRARSNLTKTGYEFSEPLAASGVRPRAAATQVTPPPASSSIVMPGAACSSDSSRSRGGAVHRGHAGHPGRVHRGAHGARDAQPPGPGAHRPGSRDTAGLSGALAPAQAVSTVPQSRLEQRRPPPAQSRLCPRLPLEGSRLGPLYGVMPRPGHDQDRFLPAGSRCQGQARHAGQRAQPLRRPRPQPVSSDRTRAPGMEAGETGATGTSSGPHRFNQYAPVPRVQWLVPRH